MAWLRWHIWYRYVLEIVLRHGPDRECVFKCVKFVEGVDSVRLLTNSCSKPDDR